MLVSRVTYLTAEVLEDVNAFRARSSSLRSGTEETSIRTQGSLVL